MYSALVINCVWDAFLSSTAIALNIIKIQALRKVSSFPKTLQTLLLSLAVSDLGVGLLVQPLFIAGLVLKTAERITNNCRICTLSLEIGQVLFASASFVGVVALTVDRFLAIHLHVRYQELVTHKRVVAAVISIWVFSALVSLLESIQIKSEVIFIILISTETVCYITTGLFYCKIYVAVQHHRNQIHALQVQQIAQNGELAANSSRLTKTAAGTFYVYVVFVACYLPFYCVRFAMKIVGETILLQQLKFFSFTLIFLNSSLIPLIYCWKMRHVRQAVKDILRNIFTCCQWTKLMHPRLRLNGIRRNFRPETGHLIRAEPFNRRIHHDVIVYIFAH